MWQIPLMARTKHFVVVTNSSDWVKCFACRCDKFPNQRFRCDKFFRFCPLCLSLCDRHQRPAVSGRGKAESRFIDTNLRFGPFGPQFCSFGPLFWPFGPQFWKKSDFDPQAPSFPHNPAPLSRYLAFCFQVHFRLSFNVKIPPTSYSLGSPSLWENLKFQFIKHVFPERWFKLPPSWWNIYRSPNSPKTCSFITPRVTKWLRWYKGCPSPPKAQFFWTLFKRKGGIGLTLFGSKQAHRVIR